MAARPALAHPRRLVRGDVLEIDAATRANLELTRTLGGAREGSLLAAIDRTLTPAGARLLAERLAAPLTDPRAIARRLDAVDVLVGDASLRDDAAQAAARRARSVARACRASRWSAAARAISRRCATAWSPRAISAG